MTAAQIRWLTPGRIRAAKHYYGAIAGIMLLAIPLTFGLGWVALARLRLDYAALGVVWAAFALLAFVNGAYVLRLNYRDHAHCRGDGRDSCTYGYARLILKEDWWACTPLILPAFVFNLVALVWDKLRVLRSRLRRKPAPSVPAASP